MVSQINTVAEAKRISVHDETAFYPISIAGGKKRKQPSSRAQVNVYSIAYHLASRHPHLFFGEYGSHLSRLWSETWPALFVYMDNSIACSSTFESHLTLLQDILKALKTERPTLKPSKVLFGLKRVNHFGHTFSASRKCRSKATVNLLKPTNIKQLRSVLGIIISVSSVYQTQQMQLRLWYILRRKRRSGK